jgi:hypothetical protein
MMLDVRLRSLFRLILVLGLLSVVPVVRAGVVTGPITGGSHGWAFAVPTIDFSKYGYLAAEYFIEGSASSYAKNGTWTRDGVWSAAAGGSAPFKTRLLVLRPADPAAFNGTVLVEWLNVTSGWDNAEVLAHANQSILRGGYAWIGVSAQAVGVQLSPFSLKAWDPARYGSLAHPGDAYAYDIFTQVAQAVRVPTGVDPLAGLAVKDVVGIGHSQAANGLATYVNAIQPLTNSFSGFLLHSRTATPLPLSSGVPVPAASIIRNDTAVPVIAVQDEWSVATAGAWLNRQPDTAKFRLWEAAGTSHIDRDSLTFTKDIVMRDLGIPSPSCAFPPNEAPLRYLVDSAVVRLTKWIGGGEPPPQAPAFIQTAGGSVVRDAYGIAMGGVRLPQVEVPTARHSGVGNGGPEPCPVTGVTVQFDAQTLAGLYATDGSYRSQFVHATNALRRSGFLLDFDSEDAKAK